MSDTHPQHKQYIYDGITLNMTCLGHPEQYDAVDENGRQVGYLRLRNGTFRVSVPDVGGKTVYMAEPKGDGMFDDEEREKYLQDAIAAIRAARGIT